jgi:crotonobetainyl-CoA:carnitine CoA-transferase CaiB-like acyl-CoA transferase
MLMPWALGQGLAAGQWPKPGGELLTGGSPRYQIYRTADGRHIAVGALEQKFWDNFCEVIGLPKPHRDDSRDPAATISKVREIIAQATAEEWQRRFSGKDCCASVMQTLQQAVAEPHFRARGIFDHLIENESGERLPALPMAIAPQFRSEPGKPGRSPALGAHNDELLKKTRR